MSEYPSPLSVISTFFGPISKLAEEVSKYKNKKKVENRFISALESETKAYLEIFNEMSDYGKNKVTPVVLSIQDIPTITQMNNLMAVAAEVPLLCIKFFKAFINVAKACYEISYIEGFMKSLEKSNISQYDFVKIMASIYRPEDSVVIDNVFFRYFKVYGDFPKFGNEFQKEIDDVNKSIGYIKKWIANAKVRSPRIDRKIRKHFLRNMRQFSVIGVKIAIIQIRASDIREYIPSSFAPFASMLEGIA